MQRMCLVVLMLLAGARTASAHEPKHFAPIVIEREQTLSNGMTGDNFIFEDAHSRVREAFMLPNDRRDALGTWGGCLHRMIYEAAGTRRTCAATNPAHPGFGYTVNHFPGSSTSSRFAGGTYHDDFIGRHHVVRRYHWLQNIGGYDVDTSVAWLIASGRDALTWGVTYDLHRVPADALVADTRAPYGDIAWDGGERAEVSGLGWGDRYLFRTTSMPVSESSSWDYSQPNPTHVPHVFAFTVQPDAEMGVVQTESFERHDAGGSELWRQWGQKSVQGPLPNPTEWPFQLNQYELPYTLASKRMAWGSNYGAVGQRVANNYGDDGVVSGWPLVSYSTLIVLDPHSAQPTMALANEVHTAESARLVALSGAAVVTRAKAGVARNDERELLTPGLDPTWYAWSASWEKDAREAKLELGVPPEGVLRSPLFVVRDYPGMHAPRVELDGKEIKPDEGALISVDAPGHRLFVTIPGPWRGAHTLTLRRHTLHRAEER